MKHFQIIKRVLPWLSLASLAVFIDPELQGFFAERGWQLLVVVMISRPLFQVFPRFTWLRYLIFFRRELAIISGSLILGHVAGYFVGTGTSVFSIFSDAQFWDFSRFLAWGLIGAIVCIPLLLTSNTWSQRILGMRWKPLQRLAYLMFLSGGIHFAMYGDLGDRIQTIGILVAWLALWILAQYRVILWDRKPLD